MGRVARAAILALLGVASVHSAILVVNNPDDSAKPVGSCGADCNLRTAWHLMEAGDTISIQVDPVMKTPITEIKEKNSFYTLIGDVSGNAGNRASFSPLGGSSGPGSAFQMNTFYGGLRLENLEFNNFTATPSTYSALIFSAEENGGPQDGDITIKDCNFVGNYGADNSVVQISGANFVKVEGCKFTNNKGGLAVGTILQIESTNSLTIVDSEFTLNSSPGSMIYASTVKFSFETTTASDNTAIDLINSNGPLFVSDCTFKANSLSSAIVYGVNTTFVHVTAELTSASESVYHNQAGSIAALALNSCKFSTKSGDDVQLVDTSSNTGTVIFNLAPSNKAAKPGFATFANCNEVQAGPLACGYGDYCVLVRNAGQAVGYLCLTSEEEEAHLE